MQKEWINWRERFNAALQACEQKNGECERIIIHEPATTEQVEAVETELGQPLPTSFKEVLINFSARVELRWSLPDDLYPPDPFSGIFRGELNWDLAWLIDLEKNRQGWIKHVFPNVDDPYDRVWHDKLAFESIANGDMLALDLKVDGSPVVYLDHGGCDFHGTVLGHNFIDFIDRWSMLGFPGPECMQFQKFVNSRTNGIEPNGENAVKWKKWFGLE